MKEQNLEGNEQSSKHWYCVKRHHDDSPANMLGRVSFAWNVWVVRKKVPLGVRCLRVPVLWVVMMWVLQMSRIGHWKKKLGMVY